MSVKTHMRHNIDTFNLSCYPNMLKTLAIEKK